MRVIGGRSRGRILHAPDLPGVRPTGDRVREAIFDILYSRGGVEGRSVLDLFAGSGALGIEALSRGARRVTLVERDRRAAAVLERNLEPVAGDARLDEDASPPPQVEVVRSDAASYLRRAPGRFDVAFCDPPYRYEGWAEILGLLDADLAVLESSAPVEVPGRFAVVRTYRYGGTLVTLAEGRQPGAAKGEV